VEPLAAVEALPEVEEAVGVLGVAWRLLLYVDSPAKIRYFVQFLDCCICELQACLLAYAFDDLPDTATDLWYIWNMLTKIKEPHRHPGVFIARGKEDLLVTKNLTPGESVYGEKRISVQGTTSATDENGEPIAAVSTEYRCVDDTGYDGMLT
jgi:hypothetical protein